MCKSIHQFRILTEHGLSEVISFFLVALIAAGFRVTYNMECPEGSRVLHLEIVCTECLVPHLEPVQDNGVYRVIMSEFLAQGGDGYHVINDNKIDEVDTGGRLALGKELYVGPL